MVTLLYDSRGKLRHVKNDQRKAKTRLKVKPVIWTQISIKMILFDTGPAVKQRHYCQWLNVISPALLLLLLLERQMAAPEHRQHNSIAIDTSKSTNAKPNIIINMTLSHEQSKPNVHNNYTIHKGPLKFCVMQLGGGGSVSVSNFAEGKVLRRCTVQC